MLEHDTPRDGDAERYHAEHVGGFNWRVVGPQLPLKAGEVLMSALYDDPEEAEHVASCMNYARDAALREAREGIVRLRAELQGCDSADIPDYVYDPDDWECTYCWTDRYHLEADVRDGETKNFSTLFVGPDKWCAKVPVAWDEDDDPEEWEARWFDSEDEAKEAINAPPPTPREGEPE